MLEMFISCRYLDRLSPNSWKPDLNVYNSILFMFYFDILRFLFIPRSWPSSGLCVRWNNFSLDLSVDGKKCQRLCRSKFSSIFMVQIRKINVLTRPIVLIQAWYVRCFLNISADLWLKVLKSQVVEIPWSINSDFVGLSSQCIDVPFNQ